MLNRFDKTYFLSKLTSTESDRKETILKELNEQFNNAKSYLDMNNKIVIGRKLPAILQGITLERGNNRKITRKTTTTKSYNGDNNTFKSDIITESIDHNELKKIFDKYKKAKMNTSEEIQLMNIPKQIESELLNQERYLSSKKRADKYKNKLSKYLTGKTNKKENDLLLNSLDLYCHKKDFINTITLDKDINETIKGKYKWNISLRRPDHFEGSRKTFINLKAKDYNPLWTVVKETSPTKKVIKDITESNQITQQSNYLSIDITKIKRPVITTNKEKSRNKRNDLQGLKSIRCTGKNLLELEYENAMKLKTLKYIRKRPIDYNNPHQDDDVNEIICKNYQLSTHKTSASLSSLLLTNQSLSSQSKHMKTFMGINYPYEGFK